MNNNTTPMYGDIQWSSKNKKREKSTTSRRTIDRQSMNNAIKTYRPCLHNKYDPIKALACAVLERAVVLASGMKWDDIHKRLRTVKVNQKDRNSALRFIRGKTASPIAGCNCFDFVCELANIEPTVIVRGIERNK